MFKNSDNRIGSALFVTMMRYYRDHMPVEFQDSLLQTVNLRQKAREIEKKSVLADAGKMKKLLESKPEDFLKSLKNDSGYSLARPLIYDYYMKINPTYNRTRSRLNRWMRNYTALMEKTGLLKQPVPDANGTLRVSFGKVKGYEPKDGVYYEPFSTLDGVMEKYIPGDYEFDLPEKLLKIYNEKDFGPYAVNGTVPVNFLGTAHTTGGNSGSPALNKKGELVGLNFDRVWEGTMSDLYYDPAICRNIMVDIRYVLFIIDKIGNDSYLLNEILAK
jgi:hypothetical protein